MVKDELSVLSAFLAVAEERSFTRGVGRPFAQANGLLSAGANA